MRNLGPQMQRMLAEIDVHDDADLRKLGAVEAWHRLRFVFERRVNLTALYAMYGALEDKSWLAVSPEEKAQLKKSAGR